MILQKKIIEKLPKTQLLDLAKFVVKENIKHHKNNKLPVDYMNDVNSIYSEELNYYNTSEIYIVKDSLETILGSIRILKWNYTDVLPIQKIFGINPLLVTNEPNINVIYHIGRFAIRKDISDLNLFKKLLFYVAQLICKHPNNIAFAECDSKLLRILNLLGVKTSVIGASVNYLGSETIPIQIDYEGSIDFYNKNKHLVENILIKPIKSFSLPQSVVSSPLKNNYSLV